MFAPLVAALAWGAIADLRKGRITNWLTFSLALSGFIQSWLPQRTVGPAGSMLGLLCGTALLLFPYALGAVGGGDVKLLAAAGAWVGPVLVFKFFVAAAIVGLLIAMGQSAMRGRIKQLFRNSAVLAVNLAHIDALGVAHTRHTAQGCRCVDRPMPYAVPMLLGCLLVLGFLR